MKMEKLAIQCLQWPSVLNKLSRDYRALANRASATLVSRHHPHRRCYHHHYRLHYSQTYPGELVTARAAVHSSAQSLWPITNFSTSLIRPNTSCNRYDPNGSIKLIYCPANKSQPWHDDTATTGPTECPLPPPSTLASHTGGTFYQRPPNHRLTFGHSSRRHICTCSRGREEHLTYSRAMNTVVSSGILRRASSASMAKAASPEPNKCDSFNRQLSQIDYKTAIHLLNQLQTNAENIQQAIEKERSSNVVRSLEKTRYFLSLIDIEPEQLNQLQVVHVAGTKGKGSTCAFVESILRHQGYKTGFYSSPHLVVARERIRINGEPISEEMFANYFGQVYTRIREGKSPEVSMPAYFNFMTVMALQIFLQEHVDVAILEVGIGGEYDCTNVVPRPVVTGITSLDLDHCKLLGDTIEKIAWQKAGIFKSDVPAFTCPQNETAMLELQKRAKEKNAPLYVAPAWSHYPQSQCTTLGINGEVQKINASLAVQLAHYWITKRSQAQHPTPSLLNTANGSFADVVALGENNNYHTALTETKWFGRCEVIRHEEVTYFLDAAHTPDSMKNCRDWFREASAEHCLSATSTKSPSKPYRILVFNCTGERNPLPLLSKLNEIAFDLAVFTTNSVYGQKMASSDVANFTVTEQREREICADNALTWNKLNPKVVALKVGCISEAIAAIEATSKAQSRPLHVLITGSVHLVGGFIGLIHPHYRNDERDGSTRL